MYNKVILIGRLVNTPEVNKTANDKSVVQRLPSTVVIKGKMANEKQTL